MLHAHLSVGLDAVRVTVPSSSLPDSHCFPILSNLLNEWLVRCLQLIMDKSNSPANIEANGLALSVHSLKSQIDSQQQNKIKCLGLHYPWASGSHANGRSQIRSLTATAFSLMHEISYSHLAVTVRRKKKILKHLLSTWLQHAWQPIRSLTMCMMIVPLFKSAFFH